ncbi:MAG: hypothetical protein KKD18_01160 [Nanoarchaeota archaeon]|nr:hypothetical protein [Nanoarchaeota archaeon]MBU0977002.1 hypothetical protein [Nanoarchaeota archaeon]
MLHEILHFQFEKYFWKGLEKKGLTENEIQHIKEATTVLINEEFLDVIPFKDWGYPLHKKFRKELTNIWRKKKDFKHLLNESVKFLKQKHKYLSNKNI